MSASKTIECVYEGGVLRPLHEVDFREGERLKLTVKKFDIIKINHSIRGSVLGRFKKRSTTRSSRKVGRCKG